VTGPIRLLIVDDHPVVRDGLRGILEGAGGFEVVRQRTARTPSAGPRRSCPTWC
jgi:DNA-binding NarL/FixJ family response regulator